MARIYDMKCVEGQLKPKYNLYMEIFTTWKMLWRRGGLVVERRTPARDRGFDPHSGRRVVSLSKIYLPPKSTGNTQEGVAPSRHD